MKNLLFLFIAFLLLNASVYPQIIAEQNQEPIFFNVKSHDPNIKELPTKSFYESKSDWQHIIDSTWGPGLPLEQKQLIFNSFISELEDEFDGFLSLGFTPATWDTFKTYYYNKIDSSTSRGRFSALMNYFSIALRDWHTYAFDNEVFSSPLNPGVPLLHITAYGDWKHAGAVVTVTPDSTIIVLRVAANHPLNLQPGDVVLGYNGFKWIDLLNELMEAELPIFPVSGGSQTAHNDAMFVGSIMNWHLFDTIDILKYATGDTVHLDLTPMVGFNTSAMTNNEQMPIPGVPFPPVPFPNFNTEPISYGIIDNTNIGYIYIFHHMFTQMNQRMFEAIDSLKNTDGLIIDMRFANGGFISQVWQEAFGILANENIYTLMDAFRCSPNNWTLCLTGDSLQTRLAGIPPDKYERPIALLTGSFCYSMGDRNAYRLSHLENGRTFGKPTYGSLGLSSSISGFPDWYLNYCKQDFALVSDLLYFLNRKELPIDFPIWHNKDDVAQGKDAVVEAALEWMGNLVYGHDVETDYSYYEPGIDTANISTVIENPNLSSITAKIFIENLEETFIDSIELTFTESAELWEGKWIVPGGEDIYKLRITTIDYTTIESFTFSNMQRITTAGPIAIDSLEITYLPTPDLYQVKPHIKNEGQSMTLDNLFITMSSDDTTITSISGNLYVNSIAPGEIIIHPSYFSVKVDSNFVGEFTFNFEVRKDGWIYWEDSYPDSIVSFVVNEIILPTNYELYQNYPNPFNNSTVIKYSIPQEGLVTLKVYNLLGEEVKTLAKDTKQTGNYEVTFDAVTLPSGIYFYKLQAGDFVETKKMVLMK